MRNTSKKHLIVATGVLFFGIAAQAFETASQCDAVWGNLIFNCGWEGNCWGGWHPSAPIVDIGRDRFAHSGSYRGIIHAHPGMEWVGQQFLNTFPDQAYRLSFWIRNFEPIDRLQVVWSADGHVEVVVFDVENIPPSEEYTQFVVENLVAADGDGAAVYFFLGNSLGDIDIDDVVLVAVDP